MSDGCIYFGDGERAEFDSESWPVARKTHTCDECRDPINPGERYHYAAGKWDGEFEAWKTCAACNDIRVTLSCDGSYVYGELWDAVHEAGAEVCHRALERLTAGRAKLSAYLEERDAKMLAEAAE